MRTGWDPMLSVLAVYIAVNIGRVHQLVPALEVLRLGMVTGALSVALLFTKRNPARDWAILDRTLRLLIVGICAWAMFTIPTSLYPGLSFNVFRDVILQSCGLALVVALALRGVEDARRLIAVFVVIIAFYSVMILVKYGVNLDVRLEELYSYDTNDFAQVVVCAIPLAIYLALQSRRIVVRMVYLLSVGLFLVILIKSGSRGGFLGLVAVGAAALVSWRAVNLRWRVGTLVGGALFLSVFASGMFLDRIASIGAESDYNVTSETGRIEAWKRGFGYMMDYPVLGVGVGAFTVAEGTISDLAIRARQQGLFVRWMAPHNSFVQIGAEMGIPGLVLFTLLCVALMRRSHRLTTAMEGGRPAPVALLGGALFLSLVGFYVTAFFLSQAYSAILYLLAGLVAGLTRAGVIRQ